MTRCLLALFFIVPLLSLAVDVCAAGQTARKIGQWRVFLFSDGEGARDPSFLVGASPELVQKYLPTGDYPTAMRYFLVRGDGKTVLIDTGLGKSLLRQLQDVGVKVEDIDAVLLTHMHRDHIGGLLTADAAALPRATIYLAEKEKAYWSDPQMMARAGADKKDSFLLAQKVFTAYGGRVKTFSPGQLETGGVAILPGITAIAAYGHTPGHSMFLLKDGDKELLFWGDLTHAMAIQMPVPTVAMVYDLDRQEAVATRLKVLQYVSGRKLPVAGAHIPGPSIGAVRAAGGGYVFTPDDGKQ